MSTDLIITPKKPTDVQHKIGNFYLFKDNIYLLAAVGPHQAIMVNLNGDRVTNDPVRVSFHNLISESEFQELTLDLGRQFEYIPTLRVDPIF